MYKDKKYNIVSKLNEKISGEVTKNMQNKLIFSIDAKECAGNLSLQIKRVGRESCKTNKKKSTGGRQYNSLHFIREGRGILKRGNEEILLRKGMCFVLYEGINCEYYQDKKDPWKYDWIDFEGENIEVLLSKCGFSIEKPYKHYPQDKYFTNELDRFFEIYNVHSTRDICVVAQFFKIISELIYYNNDKNHSSKKMSTQFCRVRDCMIYINNNYYLDLTLEEIAKANNISVSYMKAIWTKEVGIAPMEYVHAFRVSEACRYLKSEMWKIKDIAKQVGYTDEKYFMRVFKKYKGMSPKEYRECSNEGDPFSWLIENNMDFR